MLRNRFVSKVLTVKWACKPKSNVLPSFPECRALTASFRHSLILPHKSGTPFPNHVWESFHNSRPFSCPWISIWNQTPKSNRNIPMSHRAIFPFVGLEFFSDALKIFNTLSTVVSSILSFFFNLSSICTYSLPGFLGRWWLSQSRAII